MDDLITIRALELRDNHAPLKSLGIRVFTMSELDERGEQHAK